MKRYLLGLLLTFLIATPVYAYTVKSGDTFCGIATKFGLTCNELVNNNPRYNYDLICPGENIITDSVLGAARPEMFYSEVLTRSLTLGGSETVVYVSALPTETEGYVIINASSASGRELFKYTGITTTAGGEYTLTGVTRGLAFSGTTGVVIPDARVEVNVKKHSSGESVSMNNGRYEQKLIDVFNGLSVTGADSLYVGTISTTSIWLNESGKKICLGSSSVCIRNSSGVLQWSVDGFSNSYNFTSSTISQLIASSTLGIQVVNGEIGINASSTTGGAFDASGKYYQAIGNALTYTGNAIAVSTSTIVSQIATSTPTANMIPIANASGTLPTNWMANGFAGDGSDGDLVLTSSSTLNPTYKVFRYENLTINTSTVLSFGANYQDKQIYIKVRNNFTLNGTISVKGAGSIGGAGGNGGGDGNLNPGHAGSTGSDNDYILDSTLHAGTAGTAGGAAAAPGAATTGAVVFVKTGIGYIYINQNSNITFVVPGAGGAGGGGGGSGQDNGNYADTVAGLGGTITTTPTVGANGNADSACVPGGNCGQAGAGGGGGAGGGAIIIEVGGNVVIGASGIIDASGQNGANGGNGATPGGGTIGGGGGGSGGSGGAGGMIYLLYNGSYSNSGTTTVAGGTGGTGGTGGIAVGTDTNQCGAGGGGAAGAGGYNAAGGNGAIGGTGGAAGTPSGAVGTGGAGGAAETTGVAGTNAGTAKAGGGGGGGGGSNGISLIEKNYSF